MSDTPTGETAKTEELKNEGSNASTQSQGNASDPAVEQARKEAEQLRMRANQLENELKKAKEAEESRKLKELEDKEEWKKLADQRQARLDELESEREREETQKALSTATDSIYSEFSEEVVEVAKEAGLGVSDDSDEARQALKEKLERISKRVTSNSKPSGNNQPKPSQDTNAQLLERMRYGDKEARKQVMSNIPAVQEMRRQAGLTE